MEDSPKGATRPLLVRLLFRLLPHLALISIFMAYLVVGALIFMELEGDDSDVRNMEKDKDDLKNMMKESHNCSQPEPPSCDMGSSHPSHGAGNGEPVPEGQMGNPGNGNGGPPPPKCKSSDDVYDHLYLTYESKKGWKIGRMKNLQANRTWEFYSAMLFCATTITTVGYGELVPVTPAGQITCIFYALIGIPLTLLLLADIGGSLGKIILLICKLIRPSMVITRIRQDSPCICCIPSRRRSNQEEDALHTQSNMTSQGGNVTDERFMTPMDLHSLKLQTLSGTNKTESNEKSSQQYSQPGSNPPSYKQSIIEQTHSNDIRENIYSNTTTVDSHLHHDGYMQQFPPHSSDSSLSRHHNSVKDIINMPCDEVVEEVPLTIVILIFLTYTTVGAISISHIEDWQYFEAIYFTVITLTTIGFGDYIPSKHYEQGDFFSCLLFTMIGMAVTSMCISLAQSKVVRFCRKMSLKFGF